MIRFEWDPAKARTNQRKHGVTFEEAANLFDDPYALFEQDRTDETGETRWRAVGMAGALILLLVVHTIREEDQEEVIRLISARRATRKERNRYEQTRAQDAG
ncbi:MAG: BrnT family toxin [Bryobacteraceae bacterium]|jgi:uncharacterized DUF497 family protein